LRARACRNAVLRRLIGGGAGLAFAAALLASGLSSSSVGTYAGQVAAARFLDWKIPLFARRLLTMLPALIVLAIASNTSAVLVDSQIVLSFGIPFALIPLVILSRDKAIMGHMANRRVTTMIITGVSVAIVALNAALIASAV
jgi:manganese transport protein